MQQEGRVIRQGLASSLAFNESAEQAIHSGRPELILATLEKRKSQSEADLPRPEH
jgi:hypothetical protein